MNKFDEGHDDEVVDLPIYDEYQEDEDDKPKFDEDGDVVKDQILNISQK